MRESTIMKIHYGTAIAAVALVAVHILMRLTQGYAESLEFESVLANYKFVPYEKAVSYGCIVAMIGLIAYGSRTIIVVNMGLV